jgi:hypothetical protein
MTLDNLAASPTHKTPIPMAKLQLNRGRINSTMTEDEVIKTSPF